MTDPRTGFAAPTSPMGQVRPFPIIGHRPADEGDRVLVRHAGRNLVFETVEEFRAALDAADRAFDAVEAATGFDDAPQLARLPFVLAAAPTELLLGAVVGIPFAALFAKVLLS